MSDKDQIAGPAAQESEATKAMEMKQAAPDPRHPTAGRTADEGMNSLPNADIAPSGALDAEGYKPVLERSRKAR
jgi:hypothetical protein